DDDDNEDDNEDDDDNDEEKESDEKTPESKRKSQIKESWTALFNRKPFNLIFDFNDSQDDEDAVNLEDSEEDEINYRRLLKEEQEHEREHTEQLIKQTSEEEAVKTETTTETPKQPSSKPVVKKKSKEEAHLAQKQFEKLLLNLPSFVPDYSKVKNPECQKQGEVFQRQLRGQRIWALQMMDANAKIPSGLMRGNTNQLGDFDLCTKISQKIKISESNNMKMKGKYCLANIDVVAAADQLKLPVHLIQGRNFIRSTINDPNHFFPRYSTINWGLCLPSACTYHDADQILDSLLLLIVAATFLATMNDYLDSPIFSSILTGKSNNDEDVKKRDESKQVEVKNGFANQILKCFSVKRNLTYLLTASDDDIKCLHGLKALSIVLLIISLKLIPMGRVPYSNRNKLTEFFNSPFSVFIRTSFLYEDVFFLISGLLTTFSILKIISCDKKSLWFRKVLMRVLRLVLPLIVVLLFYAFVWEHLGTGPQWSAVVDKNADLCKSNMWKNFLFIQNFYNIEDMCATHTYHLAVDMQLMILSPFLIFFIYKHPSFGLGLYGILHALSAAARFSSTVDNRLSVVVFHGMKLSQLYRTFNITFSVALHRLTPYLSGISLGILIKEYGRVKLPFGVAISGWISTLCGFIWCFYTPSNLSHKDYQYDPTTAAQYSAMSPMIWSISIAWIIFACYSDASWKLNDILSSRPMIFLSRISYSLYLVVFLVFFYFSGSHKSSEEFYISSYIDRLELFIVFTAAICFTLCVDLPFKNITKLLFDCEHHEKEPTSANQESSEVDFESPFADDEDDFVFRRTKLKHEDNSKINTNGEHLNGSIENETEEEKPRKSSKFENNMNARRWKWEILDE
ncbi:CLUMA_CG001105, isoform A, partial [Clunio marinus]